MIDQVPFCGSLPGWAKVKVPSAAKLSAPPAQASSWPQEPTICSLSCVIAGSEGERHRCSEGKDRQGGSDHRRLRVTARIVGVVQEEAMHGK